MQNPLYYINICPKHIVIQHFWCGPGHGDMSNDIFY